MFTGCSSLLPFLPQHCGGGEARGWGSGGGGVGGRHIYLHSLIYYLQRLLISVRPRNRQVAGQAHSSPSLLPFPTSDSTLPPSAGARRRGQPGPCGCLSAPFLKRPSNRYPLIPLHTLQLKSRALAFWRACVGGKE